MKKKSQTNGSFLRSRVAPLNIKSYKLPAAVLVLAGVLGSSANAQLLHNYNFATDASDSVGNANGTLIGGTINDGLTTTGGLGGGSQPVNGVQLPASAVAGITGAFTINQWFLANYNGGYCTTFSFSDGTTGNYILGTPARGNWPYASTISVVGGGGSWTGPGDIEAAEQYQDNATLHEMTVTYDGSTLSYYIDGVLGSYSGLPNSITDPGLNLSTLTDIGINGGSPWLDNSINGTTYEFSIFGQALTAAQVQSLYGLGDEASDSAIDGVVPEPTSLRMAGVGLLTLALSRIKLKKSVQS